MVSKGKKRTASAPAQGAPPAKKQEVEQPVIEFKVADMAELVKSDASKDAGLLKAIAPLGKDLMASKDSQLTAFCRPIPVDVMAMMDDDEDDDEEAPPMEERVTNVVEGLFGDNREMIINELQNAVVPGPEDDEGMGMDMENMPEEVKAALAKMMAGAEDDDDDDDEAADGGETKLEGGDEEGDDGSDNEDPQEGEEGGMFQEISPEKVLDFQTTGFFKRGDEEEDETKVSGNVKALIQALAKHSKNGKVYRYCYQAITFEEGDDEDEEEEGEKVVPTEEEKEFKAKAVARLKEFMGTILSDEKFKDSIVAGYVVMTANGNYLGFEAGAPLDDFKADFGDDSDEEEEEGEDKE